MCRPPLHVLALHLSHEEGLGPEEVSWVAAHGRLCLLEKGVRF